MWELDSIDFAKEDWLETIPLPAAKTIGDLLTTGKTYREVAELWLSNNGPDANAGFGGVGKLGNYFSNFISELNAFLCGEKRYAQERKRASEIWKTQGKTYVVSAISSAIALKIGLASAVLVPCVALVLGAVWEGWPESIL